MNQEIEVTAQINAPIDQTWKHYTNPDHITQWNFATDDWCCPSASNDLRVGGKYYARMEAKDGSFGFDFEAIYKEVIPKQRLKYALTDGRNVQIDFIAQNNHTNVMVSFEAEQENPTDMQRDGWQAILNNFKAYTEGKNM